MKEKVCHILLMSYFRDGSGYQENILSKKHVQLGYEVSLISTVQSGESRSYTNADDVVIHLLPHKHSFLQNIPYVRGMVDRSIGLLNKLEEITPDIIFIHGVCFPEIRFVVEFKKRHPGVRVFADNHQDYYNSRVTLTRKLYNCTYNSYFAHSLTKISERIWGVSPWRVDYMVNEFHIPRSKTGLLVMGGDDDFIDWSHRAEIRTDIRDKYNIPEEAFLIVTGGKIDITKNVHLLEKAIASLPDTVYLIVFGKMTDEVKSICEQYSSERIVDVGWVKSEEVYPFFLASDLAVFPGTHSVLWEQACASGIPAVFRDWDGGFSHVDVGGNCVLLKDPTAEVIKKEISDLINNEPRYRQMCSVAETKARNVFSYREIAKRAIETD